MRWSWLHLDGDMPTLEIPRESYKTNMPHVLPLSSQALDVIQSLPRWKEDCVFTSTAGHRPISGFSKAKKQIDTIITKVNGQAIKPWVNHDLRRTIRTNLPRFGISNDIAERVLGHVINGVRGVYDKYTYLPQKQEALDVLSCPVRRHIN